MVIIWEKAVPTNCEALNARCGLLVGELVVSTSTGSAPFLFPIIEMNQLVRSLVLKLPALTTLLDNRL